MKKTLLLLALMLPLWLAARTPEAEFNKSWVEYDVFSNGKKGVRIHFDFIADGCKGDRYELYLYLQDENQLWVRSNMDGYKNAYGQFTLVDPFTPNYLVSHFDDYEVFVPYEAVSQGVPKAYWAQIAKNSKCAPIGTSKKYSLNWPAQVVTAKAPKVTFNKSWVEYDVYRDGEKGLAFHYDVNVDGCKGKELFVNTFVWNSKGEWVKSRSDSDKHKNRSGYVYDLKYFKPLEDKSRWNDLELFIPYSAMPLAENGLTYSYSAVIGFRYQSDGAESIQQSQFYPLDWAAHSPKSTSTNDTPLAKIDKIWIDQNQNRNDQNGIVIHANVVVNNRKDNRLMFCCYFYDKNGNQLKTTNSTYASSDGYLIAYYYDTPQYDNTRWSDMPLFVPYSVFPQVSGKSDYYLMYYVRDPSKNFENLVSQRYDFSININGVNTNCEKPTIDWLSDYSSTIASFEVRAGVKSKSEVTSTGISVNGNTYRGMKTVKNDGYQMRINETVTLREGSNEIVLSATNSCGTTTKTYTVSYTKAYTEPVYAEKRVALVIGNSNYQSSPLANPVNDANDIAASLRDVGFDVKTVLNGSKRDMENAIADLRKRSDKNTVALFYYAGHGIQKDGCNYLVPVDANMQDAADVEYACTDVNRVLSNMEASGCTMNIIILDACRDNPFERSWSRGLGTRGLSTLNAPRGTFISYATAPGDVAQDGKGRNSPYADAFIKTLKTPGLGLYDFFQKVEIQVENNTGGTQIPWMSSSFRGQFYFNPKQ
jgi:hypothetical protein